MFYHYPYQLIYRIFHLFQFQVFFRCDIQFQNYWDTDQFNYLTGTTEITVPVNNFYLKETSAAGAVEYRNIWRKTSEKTHQYHIATLDKDLVAHNLL